MGEPPPNQMADEDGPCDSRRVRQQAGQHGMAGFLDADGSEVDGEDIKRRVGRPLHRADEVAEVRVRTAIGTASAGRPKGAVKGDTAATNTSRHPDARNIATRSPGS